MTAQDDTDEIVKYKQFMSGLFDRAAPTYDQVGPKFFAYFGRRLVELANIRPGSHILDVATGRGASLFPSAEVVGPNGYAVGIDFSVSMVEETSAEIQRLGLQNVKVSLMDAEDLQFPDASFDYVLCNLSIFIFPRHDRALSEMHRVLKPGGTIGLSTFWHDDERWKWLGELFSKYLPQPGKEETSSEEESLEEEEPPPPDFRSHEGMEAVMNAAGFTNILINGEEPDFVYTNE